MESQVIVPHPNLYVVKLGYNPNLDGFKGAAMVRPSKMNNPPTYKDSAGYKHPNKHITQTGTASIRAQNCPFYQWY